MNISGRGGSDGLPAAFNSNSGSSSSSSSSSGTSSKISLALLKGRSAAQSVPSISFRFNTASDDITQIEGPQSGGYGGGDQSKHAEVSHLQTTQEHQVSVGSRLSSSITTASVTVTTATTTATHTTTSASVPHSSVLLDRRSSSLDDASPNQNAASTAISSPFVPTDNSGGPSSQQTSTAITPTTPIRHTTPTAVTTPSFSTPSSGGSGLFSRLSKTLEGKINEIRQEKLLKEKERRICATEEEEPCGESDLEQNSDVSAADTTSENSPVHGKPNNRSLKKSLQLQKDVYITKSGSVSLCNSPSKKSSIVQDLTELKSELSRNIPKLSELRNRKSNSKECRNRSSFTLNALLGRDDGLPLEDPLLPEEGEGLIEAGVEAEEDACLFGTPDSPITTPATATAVPADPLTEQAAKEAENPPLSGLPPTPHKASPILNTKATLLITNKKSTRERIIQCLKFSNTLSNNFIMVIVCILGILLRHILLDPIFIFGVFVGVVVVAVLGYLLWEVLLPTNDITSEHFQRTPRPFILNIPLEEDQQQHKGWLNKLDDEYCPENYHVSRTHSVCVRLHGSKLQLDHPRRKVSKHCRYGEDLQCGSGGFVHHREYDLTGASVLLMPRNLPRRWLWSRKYPICLRLRRSAPVSPAVTTAATPSPQQQQQQQMIADQPSSLTLDAPPAGKRAHTERDGSVESDRSESDNYPTTIVPSHPMNTSTSTTTIPTSGLEVGSGGGTRSGGTGTAVGRAGEVGAGDDGDLDSFEEITQDMCAERTLYLFARSDREKDDWFRLFVEAANVKQNTYNNILSPAKSHTSPVNTNSNKDSSDMFLGGDSNTNTPKTEEASSVGVCETTASFSAVSYCATATAAANNDQAAAAHKFDTYMAQLLYKGDPAPQTSVTWINAMAGRLLYDFLHNPYWANKIQERVQRKLSKVHVPYFVGELIVCGVQLGSSIPQLRSVGAPYRDARGLWCDLSVNYEGNFTMTIETKLDLMKLKKSEGIGSVGASSTGDCSSASNCGRTGGSGGSSASTHYRSYVRSSSSHDLLFRDIHFDTDTDDSVESSSEDDGGGDDDGSSAGGTSGDGLQGGGRRLMKLVDSVTGSRYFQHAAEWRVAQKAFRGVSNTRIILTVEVVKLCGTLAVNIPPQPSDRVWYGFRTPPELVMLARPKLGDRTLNLPFLADFIQKQIRIVFEKVFVLPNMDDLVVPIMSPLLPGQTDLPKPPWDTSLSSTAAASCTQPNDNNPPTRPQSKTFSLSDDDTTPLGNSKGTVPGQLKGHSVTP